jgi:hypothetical protein
MSKKIILNLGLFMIIFLLSYLYFLDQYTTGALAFIRGKFSPTQKSSQTLNKEPKTEKCPLNGGLLGKSQKVLWEARRPLGVMVENSVDARPQSGLSSADVVFEAVAEGGITRFLAVYYCQDAKIIGPVRSARVYYLDLIGGFGNDPLYAHVGGANTPGPANALGQIEDEGWAGYNDLNQFSIGFPAFWRDYERLPNVALEHTMYASSERLWEIAADRGLTNKDKKGTAWDAKYESWEFEEEAPLAKRPESQTIKFGFWENYHNFDVLWKYDKNNNNYQRFNGGKKHIDNNTKAVITANNVVVLFMEESVAQDGYEKGQHMLYETTGSGRAILFKNGQATKAKWEKEDRYSQVFLTDTNNKSLNFVPGPIWFAVLPTDNKVSYQ